MKEVVEHYGLGFLGIISVILVYAIVFKSYLPDGVIVQMIENYFIMLCGLE